MLRLISITITWFRVLIPVLVLVVLTTIIISHQHHHHQAHYGNHHYHQNRHPSTIIAGITHCHKNHKLLG